MGRALTYGSVCSGVEAATVAWHQLGWKPEWFSEIETFPSAVLQHHYPNVPNRGDMTNFKEWPDEPIDVLVGGTPCQSFSVAGLRKGLDDPRGNLMLTYLAIAARYRPRWLVWENVPGVLSSNKGRDFGTFLGALGECGYGFAYRVLDAQYFGVAQRRRRVFVIGYLGNWQHAAAVLFERESLSGYPSPRREPREEVAACLTRGVGQRYDPETETLPVTNFDAYNNQVTGDVSKTVVTGQDYHHVPIAFSSNMSVPDCQSDGTTPTLKLGGRGGGNPPAVAISCDLIWRAGDQANAESYNNLAGTLNCNKGQRGGIIAKQAVAISSKQQSMKTSDNVANTLSANDYKEPQAVMQSNMQVRRLTPTECERLQGFPDDYTQIAWRNKAAEDCPDGPRYKAMGNSMAVPVMRWLGERIQKVENIIQEGSA
jgi:DNA (cytosine-5)-methyltransferase 1